MMRFYFNSKLRQIYGIYKFNNLHSAKEQSRIVPLLLKGGTKNSAINFCGLGIFFRFALI